MTLKETIEIIKAYAEGKPIEVYAKSINQWINKSNNIWDLEEGIYRINHNFAPKFKAGDVLVFIGDVNTTDVITYEIIEVKQGYYLFNNTSRRPIEEVEKEYVSERDVLWYFEFYDYSTKEYSLSSTRMTISEINDKFGAYHDTHSWQPMYNLGFKLKEN